MTQPSPVKPDHPVADLLLSMSLTPTGRRDISPFWLDRLAELWPDRVAITNPDESRHYSYVELRNQADATAAGLVRYGVGKGNRVATLMPNGVELVDLLFACARLGAILVPMNWRLSGRELGRLLTDTEPTVLVCSTEYGALARSAAGAVPIVTLERMATDGPVPKTSVQLDDPWLILYTGGTTGVPKGAVLTHGAITWNAINTVISWGMSEADCGPSFTPMFHTGGWNVFTLPLLLFGGRVILPRRFDPTRVLPMVAAERPSLLFMVPTMFQLVAEQPDFEDADLSSLRWAISGGAPLPEPIYQRWQHKVPVFKQGYGLTEVGPNNFATPDVDAVRKHGTVGRLTYFARARIVDDRGVDVADNTPGELLLTGPHMCAGYWRRPEATAEALRDGWFHTGDIARRDTEGYYYIVDRKKDMIITGGENVYPTEVEAVLYEHAAVREAVVVGLPDPLWGEAVCAVVALHPRHTAVDEDLRDHMRERLARYKVPKTFVLVDDLPKSDAGKIIRTAARELAIRLQNVAR